MNPDNGWVPRCLLSTYTHMLHICTVSESELVLVTLALVHSPAHRAQEITDNECPFAKKKYKKITVCTTCLKMNIISKNIILKLDYSLFL